MAKVTIGCRLPHGIILEANNRKVELRGLNKAMIIGAGYATTEVDADFWEAWKTENKGFAALANLAIFEAKNASEAAAVSKEAASEKTGFEAIEQGTMGVESSEG